MKQTVNLHDFAGAFERMGRMDNFTHYGLEVLFEDLEEYEESSGEDLELDVIALCCEYTESDPETISRDYCIDISECENDDEIRETVLVYLAENTHVCGQTDKTIVYQCF